MVGGNSSENMVIASMWSSMAAWFTPVVLFGLMNLIVAIIFIANNNNNKDNNKHNEQDQHEDYQVRGGGDIFTRLTRVNSLFERVKSINVSSYMAAATAAAESEETPAHLKKLATYSSLSRLAQSIHFPTLHGIRSSGGESTQPEPENAPPPPPRRRATSNRSSLERVKSVRFSSAETESSQISDSPGQLVRVSSFIERVKSFKISSPLKSGAPITESEDTERVRIAKPDHNSIRSKSEKSSPAKKPAVEIKKTRSEIRLPSSDDEEEEDYDSRRPATAREGRNSGDAGVDAKADDFITRFRQQLKLQRVESLVRYNDILQRRTSY